MDRLISSFSLGEWDSSLDTRYAVTYRGCFRPASFF
jgi:hypothetical protein